MNLQLAVRTGCICKPVVIGYKFVDISQQTPAPDSPEYAVGFILGIRDVRMLVHILVTQGGTGPTYILYTIYYK